MLRFLASFFLIAMVDIPFCGEVSIPPDAYLSVLNGLKVLEAIPSSLTNALVGSQTERANGF